MRMVKHWAPGRGAACEITLADSAALQTGLGGVVGVAEGVCRNVPDTLQQVNRQHRLNETPTIIARQWARWGTRVG